MRESGSLWKRGIIVNLSPKRKPVHVSVAIQEVLSSLEQSDLRQCGKIFVHWAEIIGEPVASHTKPWQVRGKKLKVLVDSSDWHYAILSCFEKEILEKVQSWVGQDVVREIRYQVGEV